MLNLLLRQLDRLNLQTMTQVLTWGLPPVVIPVLRFFQDEPSQRVNLFFRDFLTYSLGACVYGAGVGLTHKALGSVQGLKLESRNFLSFITGLGANLLFAGLASVPLSKKVEKMLNRLQLFQHSRQEVLALKTTEERPKSLYVAPEIRLSPALSELPKSASFASQALPVYSPLSGVTYNNMGVLL